MLPPVGAHVTFAHGAPPCANGPHRVRTRARARIGALRARTGGRGHTCARTNQCMIGCSMTSTLKTTRSGTSKEQHPFANGRVRATRRLQTEHAHTPVCARDYLRVAVVRLRTAIAQARFCPCSPPRVGGSFKVKELLAAGAPRHPIDRFRPRRPGGRGTFSNFELRAPKVAF